MLAIIVPKRLFKRAVDRNRARRRIRAALDQLKPGWRRTLSGKVFADAGTIALPFPELQIKLKNALRL